MNTIFVSGQRGARGGEPRPPLPCNLFPPSRGLAVKGLAAIAGVVLNDDQVTGSLDTDPDSAARLVDRIGLPFVLRDLCRRRKSIELHTHTGLLTGTIDRVGRDHIDMAVHPPGTLRRAPEVHQYRIVPLTQIQLVRLR